MMRLKVFLLSIAILSLAFGSCTNQSTEFPHSTDNVTFYNVPLECNAYPEIGCGSRSKPILVDLENSEHVKEAWLNRTGTVIAVVGDDKSKVENIARSVLEKYDIDYNQFEIKENFKETEQWYRGSDVDKLSIEEAEYIAQTYTDLFHENKLITEEEAYIIKEDIENYFKSELVKFKTSAELNEDIMSKYQMDVINIFIGYLGEERTDKLIEFYNQYGEE